MSLRSLNARQQRFIEEYLVDLNAAQAAARAGYSQKTARYLGRDLLSNTHIQTAIAQRQAMLQEEVHVRQHDVLHELKRVAFSTMRAVAHLGPDGVVLSDSTTLTPDVAATVQEVRSTTRTRTFVSAEGETTSTVEVQTSIKLYNKLQALEDLGKHLGILGTGKGSEGVDEHFLLGLVELVNEYASGGEARQALIAYVRRQLPASAA
jgi:phage terminase small subunit